MKLRTRLFAATALIITASTVAVGAAGYTSAYESEIERVDAAINSVFDAASASASNATSAAVEDASLRTVQVSVAILDSQEDVITIEGDDTLITKAPDAAKLILAEKKAVSINSDTQYRLRSYSEDGGTHLLIAADISAIESARIANLNWLFGFSLTAVLIALAVLWLVIRFDIRIVERLARDAKRIANGEEDVALPRTKGDSEVAQLSKSLGEMVHSLESAIRTERGAQQAMQSFMGDASHELRTPLTVIKGYAEMLGSQGAKKEFREKALQRITYEVVRMEQLINDLLLLAELGETRERPTAVVDLSEMVGYAVTDLKSLDTRRKVVFDIQPGVTIDGSAEHLQQMLNNIFSNIRRHTPKSAPVNVQLSATTKSIELVIEDGGAGLPEAAYNRGIDSFERFDAFASRQNGGSGLGMTIMRTIARQHHGTISLSKSKSLGGLRTEIKLPR